MMKLGQMFLLKGWDRFHLKKFFHFFPISNGKFVPFNKVSFKVLPDKLGSFSQIRLWMQLELGFQKSTRIRVLSL
jgi:hypothetical protein